MCAGAGPAAGRPQGRVAGRAPPLRATASTSRKALLAPFQLGSCSRWTVLLMIHEHPDIPLEAPPRGGPWAVAASACLALSGRAAHGAWRAARGGGEEGWWARASGGSSRTTSWTRRSGGAAGGRTSAGAAVAEWDPRRRSSASGGRARRRRWRSPWSVRVRGAAHACAHAWRLPAPPAALPRERNSSVHPVRVTSVVCAPSHLGGLRAS